MRSPRLRWQTITAASSIKPKHKQASFGGLSPSPTKVPVITAEADTGWMRACWRIERMQFVDPYGWHQLDASELMEIRRKLIQFEQKTWNEIFVKENKYNHSVAVKDFDCSQAKQWMAHNLPREDELWTLYLGSTERIWGIRRAGAFHIIFYDPSHQVKLSLKKHT